MITLLSQIQTAINDFYQLVRVKPDYCIIPISHRKQLESDLGMKTGDFPPAEQEIILFGINTKLSYHINDDRFFCLILTN